MLDLSNNNATGHNFVVAHRKGGQLRLILKRCQGVDYIDKTYPSLRRRALRAGMRVGAYDFLEPLTSTPAEAADYLLRLIAKPLVPGHDLRPTLDCEHGTPTTKVGVWIKATADIVARTLGVRPLTYGSGYWLEGCGFSTAPGPLWLAAYGRNDGREYPVGRLPGPWKTLTAHQYTSEAHVIGIEGSCDLSHVYRPGNIEVPRIA